MFISKYVYFYFQNGCNTTFVNAILQEREKTPEIHTFHYNSTMHLKIRFFSKYRKSMRLLYLTNDIHLMKWF